MNWLQSKMFLMIILLSALEAIVVPAIKILVAANKLLTEKYGSKAADKEFQFTMIVTAKFQA